MGTLLAGTSSWSEKSWEGVFYPPGTAPRDFLSIYAGRFPTVEADVTYYRIPSRRMVEGWAARAPEGFLLAAKFPRSVVHCGEGPAPDASRCLVWDRVGGDVERFLEVMSCLGEKQGPLLLQFPYFNRKVFPGPEPFLERLDAFLGRLPGTARYAVEVRNAAWIAPPLLEVLRARAAALVLVDLAYMPHPADLCARLDAITTDFSYVRLIGDRAAVEARTRTFDRIVMDRTERLQRWAELLRDLLPRVREVFAYANNHYAGHAPATIRQLASMVGRPLPE